jgi:hypothetical protein
MSCSIDHYLKMWSLQTFKLKKAIDDSETYRNELKFVQNIFRLF